MQIVRGKSNQQSHPSLTSVNDNNDGRTRYVHWPNTGMNVMGDLKPGNMPDTVIMDKNRWW